MKKKHVALIISLVFVGIAVLLAIGAYLYYARQFQDHFFKGTIINGMDVSGMTVDEVEQLIEENADRSYNLTVSFRGGDTETITADDIRYRYESNGSVQDIKDQQNPKAWIKGFFHPETKDVQVPMVYDSDLLDEKIASFPELMKENMTAPTDAYMDFKDTKFVVMPETEGTLLNAEKAANLIREAVASHETSLNIEEADPDIYYAPQIRSDNKKLNEEVSTLNAYTGASITYDLPGEDTQVLDGSVLKNWLVRGADGTYIKDEETWNTNIVNYVAAMAEKVDTIGTQKYFPATGIGDVLVTCWTYGYQINQEEEIAQLTEELNNGTVTERKPIYNYWETSEPDVNNGFGDTYIEIDCSRQHLWAYQDGEVAFETDIISGAMTKNRATPSGAFMFTTKESPSELVGRNANGTVAYRTTVTYFMAFDSKAIGIHDAVWQPAFGGTMYMDGYGSHGCVNVSYSAAETLYNMITFDEPVVVYY